MAETATADVVKSIDNIRGLFEANEKALTRVGSDVFDGMDALDREQVDKLWTFAGEGLETMQADLLEKSALVKTNTDALAEEITKTEALQERITDIEAEASRLKSDPNAKDIDPDVLAYRKDWNAYLRNHSAMIPGDISEKALQAYAMQNLPDATEKSRELFLKDLTAGVGSQGGYYVIPERREERITRTFETSPMRALATVINTSSNSLEIVVDDNDLTTGGWAGETQVRGDTGTPPIQKLTIPVHEQFAQPKATQTMLDDAAVDVEAWLNSKVEDKFTRDENTAFVSGNGNDKPKGFLAMASWGGTDYVTNALERVSAGAAGTFTADGLQGVQNALFETHQGNSVWGLKRASFLPITILKGSDGQYLFSRNLLAEGSPMVLLGRPVVFMDDMPAVANDAEAIVYGDFRPGYTIVDRIGIRVLVDPLTEKPYVKFYTTKRVGGAVTNYESLKIGVTTS